MTGPLYASAAPGGSETGEAVRLVLPAEAEGERLDRALARAAAEIPGLSRSRIAQLLDEGAVEGPDGPVRDARRKARAGDAYVILPPPPALAAPQPEAIPLAILHEDAHLLVIDKPPGMVVHPAPGAERGTLVNALLAHCGDSLSGIGGARRPGIVHRIDKDTSGLLVVAKTQAAHEGLAAQFAEHSVDRRYLALSRGAPDRAEPRLAGLPGVSAEPDGLRIETEIARHRADRTRMAVVSRGGKRAVTHLRVLERFGPPGAAFAARLDCRLETGRTHQIRVHAAHIGHPLLGDPVYARRKPPPAGTPEPAAAAIRAFARQALHAARLGFLHPATGERLLFETPPPADLAGLIEMLRRSAEGLR